MCMLSRFSVSDSATWSTVARQAPLFMGFSRQGYCSELPCPRPEESSWLRDRTCISYVSCIGRRFFNCGATWEAPRINGVNTYQTLSGGITILIFQARKLKLRGIQSPRATQLGSDCPGMRSQRIHFQSPSLWLPWPLCSTSLKMLASGNSLAVQWLGLHASTAGYTGSIPGPGTKIPQAAQCNPNKQKAHLWGPNCLPHDLTSTWDWAACSALRLGS